MDGFARELARLSMMKPRSSEEVQFECEVCRDAQWVRVSGNAYQPCECYARRRALETLQYLESASDLRGQLKRLTFEQLKPVGNLEKIIPVVKRFTAWEDLPNPPITLLIWGDVGVGKTHLAAALTNARNAAHRPTLFVKMHSILRWVRAGFQDGSADKRLDLVRRAPALVIDDLGVERSTPWAEETTYDLVDSRIIEMRLTVVTSNLAPSEIEPRIRSRLVEGVVAHIVAPDHRLSNKGGTL